MKALTDNARGRTMQTFGPLPSLVQHATPRQPHPLAMKGPSPGENENMACRIVLLHATPIAMQPVQTAFAERWPEAEIVNLLDDGLTLDRAREADLSPAMIDRF